MFVCDKSNFLCLLVYASVGLLRPFQRMRRRTSQRWMTQSCWKSGALHRSLWVWNNSGFLTNQQPFNFSTGNNVNKAIWGLTSSLNQMCVFLVWKRGFCDLFGRLINVIRESPKEKIKEAALRSWIGWICVHFCNREMTNPQRDWKIQLGKHFG